MLVPSRTDHGADDRVWRRLARMPRALVFLVALALVLAGLFVPGPVGGALLLVLALAMGALLARTWPVTPPARRRVRAAVLLGLVTVAVVKIFWSAW